MKEAYITKKFTAKSLAMITLCDAIVNEFSAQGYMMTIRQLYYQLVARGHIENTVQSYDNVQALVNNARLAGLIDWDAVEDRERVLVDRSHWTSGAQILHSAARSYHEDMWTEQDYRVIVIVEKEALTGVVGKACHEWDVPLLPAKGYPSSTALRELAKGRIMRSRQHIVVLHLGDHDPSGIDMSRDLTERLELFSRSRVSIDFRRLALNMDQVEEQQPPPNPAKVTDARYEGYRALYGEESWELDALSPSYLHELVATEIETLVDPDQWAATQARIDGVKDRLQTLANKFED